MTSPAKPWSKMTAEARVAAVRPLEAESSTSIIAWRLGAPKADVARICASIRKLAATEPEPVAARTGEPSTPPPWETMNRSGKEAACRPLLAKGLTYSKIARMVGSPSRNSIGTIAAALRLKDGTPPRRFPSPTETRDARKKRRAAAAKTVAKPVPARSSPAPKPAKPTPAPRGRKMRLIAGVDQVQIGAGPKAASKYDFKNRALQRAASPGIVIRREVAFEPIPGTKSIGILDLNSMTCRWPVSDSRGTAALFCGASCEFEKSYCTSHSHLARANHAQHA